MKKSNPVWEKNYRNKRYNKYPFDLVVSFIFKNFKNKIRKNVKVLDLGCGGGNNSTLLQKKDLIYMQ